MAALGTLDRYGFGGPKNPQSSIAWYIMAGEAGNPEGDLMAGFAYRATLRDWGGVPDYPKARYYLERAAAKGNEIAMLHLGEMLAEGQGGPVDRSAAKAWLERAEKAGYTSAGDKLKAYQLR
jgi:TPR repeat protein